MAISSTISTGPYTGNGATTAFPFDFTVTGSTELVVQVNGVTVSPSLYTVTLNAAGTGTVTFLTAPASGSSILLVSQPDWTQESTFENEGAYKLDTVNLINRRAGVRSNYLARALARILPSGWLNPATLAGKYLMFDPVTGAPSLDTPTNFASLALTYRDQTLGYRNETQGFRDQTLTYRNQAQDAANAIAGWLPQYTYPTYALALAAIGSIPASQVVMIVADEGYFGQRTYRQKNGASLDFLAYVNSNTGGRTFWIDPSAVSDGTGTALSPFKYFSSLKAVIQSGDIVRGCYSATGWQTVKETLDFSAFNNITWDLPGFIFQAFDQTSITWSASGTANVWVGTVTLNFTGSGATNSTHLANSNKVYAGFSGNGTICATESTNGQLGTASAATLNAALASAAEMTFSIRNGPLVGGTPSGQTNGWVVGAHDVHLKSTVDPNTMTWKVQQRGQPLFGTGHRFRGHMVVFGGFNSNGVSATDPTVEGYIDVWYPSNHGGILPGWQGPGKYRLFFKQPTGSAGYGFHLFNAGNRRRFVYLNSPEFVGYGTSSLDNVFGGHGQEISGHDIGEGMEVNDPILINCTNVGTIGALTAPMIINRLKARGILSTGWTTTNLYVIEPDIVQRADATSGLFGNVANGCVVNIEGGSVVSTSTVPVFQQAGTGTGTLNFNKTKMLVGGNSIIAGWFGPNVGTFNFTKCMIEARGGSEAAYTHSATNGATVTLTDCATAGLTYPTGTTFTRCQRGGRIGLTLGVDGNIVSVAERGLERALGEVVIDAAWPVANTDGYTVGAAPGCVLTRNGAYFVGGTNGVFVAAIRWTALAAYTLTGMGWAWKNFNNPRFVFYGTSGGNPVVLTYSSADGVSASPTAIDMSAFAGKTITGRTEGSTATGKLWLGCSDGTLIEIDAYAGTATARVSSVTYPLLHGVVNGSTVLFAGSDAAGSSGTVGGAIVSTDAGATWGNSIASGDGSAADTGDWEKRLKCAAFVNGFYLLSGARGTLLYSSTAASGSWTVLGLQTDADVRTMAVDAVNKRVLWGGDPGLGLNYRGAPMGFIDANQVGGVELIGTKTAYDPGSIASGASLTTTVTVTGVALGDFVEDVALSIDIAGLEVSGEVTATNTVTLRYSNLSGSAVDLASHNATVLCRTATAHPGTWKYRLVDCPVSSVGTRILFAGNVTVAASIVTPDCWVVPGQFAQIAISDDPLAGWRRTEWPLPQRAFARDYSSEVNSLLLGA